MGVLPAPIGSRSGECSLARVQQPRLIREAGSSIGGTRLRPRLYLCRYGAGLGSSHATTVSATAQAVYALPNGLWWPM